jgi:hypothetical protein
MVRYFYAGTPFVVVGTVVILCMPWLGLIAVMVAAVTALTALAALASAIVVMPYMLIRALARRWQMSGATPRTAPALTASGQAHTFQRGRAS